MTILYCYASYLIDLVWIFAAHWPCVLCVRLLPNSQRGRTCVLCSTIYSCYNILHVLSIIDSLTNLIYIIIDNLLSNGIPLKYYSVVIILVIIIIDTYHYNCAIHVTHLFARSISHFIKIPNLCFTIYSILLILLFFILFVIFFLMSRAYLSFICRTYVVCFTIYSYYNIMHVLSIIDSLANFIYIISDKYFSTSIPLKYYSTIIILILIIIDTHHYDCAIHVTNLLLDLLVILFHD